MSKKIWRIVDKKRSNCRDCKFKQIVKYPNGDFICIAKLKKPYKHTVDKKSKNNWIRECHQIIGLGRRMFEMDLEELWNRTVLSVRLFKKLNVKKIEKKLSQKKDITQLSNSKIKIEKYIKRESVNII